MAKVWLMESIPCADISNAKTFECVSGLRTSATAKRVSCSSIASHWTNLATVVHLEIQNARIVSLKHFHQNQNIRGNILVRILCIRLVDLKIFIAYLWLGDEKVYSWRLFATGQQTSKNRLIRLIIYWLTFFRSQQTFDRQRAWRNRRIRFR